MKNVISLISFAILFTMAIPSYAQVVISDGTPSAIDGSAVFELQSDSLGMLMPKMTTAQRNAISSPATGLLVFDITVDKFYVYNGSAWVTSNSNWLGSTTRIKLLPKDFIGTLGGGKGKTTALSIYHDPTNDEGYAMTTTEDGSYLVAFVALPSGYKATSVTIYGSNTSESFFVYEGNITSTDNLNTSGNSAYLGTATISTSGGTVTFSSAVSSTTTNYLIVAASFANKDTDILYGGYVSIEPD